MKQNLPDKAFVAFVCLLRKLYYRSCAHGGGNRARLERVVILSEVEGISQRAAGYAVLL